MSRPRSPEEWYVSIAPLLRTIATRKFRVPRDDADALVHDVFISFLRRRDIDDVRAWFIGAISHACRDYWRKQGRIVTGEAMEERMFEPAEIERVMAHEVLRALTPREQRVLWLRFAEGFTVKEVAHAIGRSVSRTEKLLRRARLRAVAVIAADEEESAHRWTKRWRCARNRHFSVLIWTADGRRQMAERAPPPSCHPPSAIWFYDSRPCTSSTRSSCTSCWSWRSPGFSSPECCA